MKSVAGEDLTKVIKMIQTERLELIPLTARQLKLLVEDLPALEQELNCYYQAEPMVVKVQSWLLLIPPYETPASLSNEPSSIAI